MYELVRFVKRRQPAIPQRVVASNRNNALKQLLPHSLRREGLVVWLSAPAEAASLFVENLEGQAI